MVTEEDLPNIDVDDIYDAMISHHGAEKGWQLTEMLLKRERLIVDCLLEHRAIVEELCGNEE